MCKFTCERPLSSIAFNSNWIACQSNELEILYVRKIDILVINETHLKENDKFRFTNYIIYRNARTDGPLSGTAICVKNGIGHRVASILISATFLERESHICNWRHFIEISGIYLPVDINKEIFIGSVYKSPYKLLTSHDLNINTKLSEQYLLACDLHAKHLAWGWFAQNPSESKLYIYCRMHTIEVPRQQNLRFTAVPEWGQIDTFWT